ncbi:hypothetical protein GCM10009642_18710 [Nocardiopsis metallicus]
MLVCEWVWVLHGFDRESGKYRVRHRLTGISDSEVARYLGLEDLGWGDIYDISESSLVDLSIRFGFKLFLKDFEYALGREAPPSS